MRLHPKKLLRSKWTARKPCAGEKHFVVVHTSGTPSSQRPHVTLQAVYTGRRHTLPWHELTDETRWRQGWH